nr:MAG TPA: hypothetical protein [Caudoviricetes sp.]
MASGSEKKKDKTKTKHCTFSTLRAILFLQ